MKSKLMVRRVMALAVCVIALVALGSAKQPVERPFKIHADAVGSLALGAYAEVGECTHGGRLINQAQMLAPDCNVGTATMANGDQLDWYVIYTTTPPITGPGEYLVEGEITFTGGTGKFERASGGFTTAFMLTVDTNWGITFSYEGEGTITY